jgi:hypothetical protein
MVMGNMALVWMAEEKNPYKTGFSTETGTEHF